RHDDHLYLHSFPTRRSSDLQEANAKVILDERDLWPGRQFVTTQLVTTKRYLERHPDVITSFLRTYVNLTLQLQRATASDLRIIKDRKSTRLNSSHVKISYAV